MAPRELLVCDVVDIMWKERGRERERGRGKMKEERVCE